MATPKFSFELTPQLKSEFDSYLYDEKRLQRASDEWHNTECYEDEKNALEQRMNILDTQLKQQVKIACIAFKMSSDEFISKLNEYTESKTK